jgi:hypothetical protein
MSTANDPPHECPSCHDSSVSYCGPIPAAYYFAGQLQLSGPVSGLYRCAGCALQFRHPVISAAQLNEIYLQTSTSSWNYPLHQRVDWQKTNRFIRQKLVNGKVLDVGCYDGSFLSHLNGGFERFGLEPNEDAARKAERSGIHILGKATTDIPARFSAQAVTAFDVIEHIQDPRNFLKQLRDAAGDNGFIIIASGTTSAPSFRFMSSRYWYCCLPEHLSFISEEWCKKTAHVLGLDIESMERYSHRGNSWSRPFVSLFQGVTNIQFKFAPRLSISAKKSLLHLIKGADHVTGEYVSWDASRDHLWCVFRKRAQ